MNLIKQLFVIENINYLGDLKDFDVDYVDNALTNKYFFSALGTLEIMVRKSGVT